MKVNVCVFLLFLYVFVETSTTLKRTFSVRVPDSFDVFFQNKNGNRSRRDVRLETRRATVVRGRVCEVAAVVVRGQVVPTAKLGCPNSTPTYTYQLFATDAVVRVGVDWVPLKTKTQSPFRTQSSCRRRPSSSCIGGCSPCI